MAEALKQAGNEAFKRGELSEALRQWRRALEYLRPDESQLAAALHNNCALVLLRLCNWKEVIAAASTTLSTEPKNEKALHRRAQARVALNDVAGALTDAATAHRLSPADIGIAALANGLIQQEKRIKSKFNPRKSLPRNRPATLSQVFEYVPLGHDPSCNIFAADMENAIPALDLHAQEEMTGYFGGAADGRHFFTTIASLGAELTKKRSGAAVATTRVRLYLNDINPATVVRLTVLLTALDKLAQCGDLDAAVKDPRTADRETASAAFLLSNLYIGGALFEEQHRAANTILRSFIADPRKSLPKWLSLGPNSLDKITDAASTMLKTTRSWTGELPRLRSYFEHVNNLQFQAEKFKLPNAEGGNNVVAAFFEQQLLLNDKDLNERFVHVEAKNAEERRAKLTQLRQLALSLPKQALPVAEALPALLTDLSSWMQNFRLSPPAQLRYLESQRLYLNPTMLDERWLSRGGNIEGFPRPDVLLNLTDELREDVKTRHLLVQCDSCADVVAMAFCRAALGLRRFLRGESAPELQVILRAGDLSADLDELQRDGVVCDRIVANNVGDYAGLLPILSSSSRLLRPSKGKASLRTNILLAPTIWASPEHYIFENSRLRKPEVKSLFHLQAKVTDVWKDLVFTTLEPREVGPADSDQVYEWLAGLFLAIARPAQRQRQMARVISSLSMAVWVATAEQARARHGDVGVLKLLRDLLNNQLTTRHRYPTSAPEKAPTKKKLPPEVQNVRPYLAELRALSTLWILPTLGSTVPDTELAAAGIPRSGIAVKVECQMPLPPEWRDDFSCGEPNNFSMGLAFFSGPNAQALERNFPNSLFAGEEGVHVFSVLHWDSPKHKVKVWLTADDLTKMQSAAGRARLFLTDYYTFVGSSTDIRTIKAHIIDAPFDDLPPLIDSPRSNSRPAAAVPPVAATSLPVVLDRKDEKRPKGGKKRSESPPDMVPIPQHQATPAAARAPPPPVTFPVSAAAAAAAAPVTFSVPPTGAPSVVPAAISAAPRASFSASATSLNFVPVSITAPLLQPATATDLAPITADEPFDPLVPHAALAPKPAQDKGVPIDADRRIAEMDAQIRSLTIQLDQAKQDAAAANARASRFEAEIAKMKEDKRKEEAWYEEAASRGGRGRGRGRVHK